MLARARAAPSMPSRPRSLDRVEVDAAARRWPRRRAAGRCPTARRPCGGGASRRSRCPSPGPSRARRLLDQMREQVDAERHVRGLQHRDPGRRRVDRLVMLGVEAGGADHDRRAGGDRRVEIAGERVGRREIDQHVAARRAQRAGSRRRDRRRRRRSRPLAAAARRSPGPSARAAPRIPIAVMLPLHRLRFMGEAARIASRAAEQRARRSALRRRVMSRRVYMADVKKK